MTIKKIKDYITGNLRFHLYYSKYLNRFLPLYIFEQIAYRLFVMDPECYSLGYCKLCGCSTPHKQMSNSQCPKPCYPKMMKAKEWGVYKEIMGIHFRYLNSSKPREFDLQIKHRPL